MTPTSDSPTSDSALESAQIPKFKELLTNPNFRPAWAAHGRKKEGWDRLSKIERKAAILLLHGNRISDLSSFLKVDLDEAVNLMASCVEKLDFDTSRDLLEFHVGSGFRQMKSARSRATLRVGK